MNIRLKERVKLNGTNNKSMGWFDKGTIIDVPMAYATILIDIGVAEEVTKQETLLPAPEPTEAPNPPEPSVDEEPLLDSRFDWTVIPGLSEEICNALYDVGYLGILDLSMAYRQRGIEALTDISGIGPARAKKMLEWLEVN